MAYLPPLPCTCYDYVEEMLYTISISYLTKIPALNIILYFELVLLLGL